MWLGLIDEPLTFILYDANAVILTLTHAWAPFAILPIYVALSKIDRSLLEAAEDLGDGLFRRFRRVTLPLSMPGVIAAALIVFIPTVGDYVTPKLIGGTDGLMIANMIQVQFGKANNAPLGAALAVSAMRRARGPGRGRRHLLLRRHDLLHDPSSRRRDAGDCLHAQHRRPTRPAPGRENPHRLGRDSVLLLS